MKLLAVEFTPDGTPHSAWAVREGREYVSVFDLEYSRAAERLLADNSGEGGEPAVTGKWPWWSAEGVAVERISVRTGRRVRGLPPGRMVALPEAWPAAVIVEACENGGTIVWCGLCRDWLDGERDIPCDHVRWCHDHGGWSGEGADDEACDCHKAPEPSFGGRP